MWVHGDDCVPLGYIINVNFFFCETAGGLGCHDANDCVQSIRVLGRIVEWTADGITWEADPRHAELIRKSFGVTGRSVATLGVRDKSDDIEGGVPIDKEAADRYRANTMRAQYLSRDRPDIQFKWQKRVARIKSWCDTDRAGCIRPRKSVSGCALVLGDCTVWTYSKGQAVIALSSGVAEHHGLVSATSQMLGVQRHSPRLEMELQRSCVDGRHSWKCDWEQTRGQTSEIHRHSVRLGASDGH